MKEETRCENSSEQRSSHLIVIHLPPGKTIKVPDFDPDKLAEEWRRFNEKFKKQN